MIDKLVIQPFISVSKHIFVCSCVYISIHMCVSVCAHLWRLKHNHNCYITVFCCFFFLTQSHLAWSLALSISCPVSKPQESSCLYLPPPPSTENTSMQHYTQVLSLGSGDWTWVLMPAWRALYQVCHHPSPSCYTFILLMTQRLICHSMHRHKQLVHCAVTWQEHCHWALEILQLCYALMGPPVHMSYHWIPGVR